MKIKLLFAAVLCAPLSLLAAESVPTNNEAADSSEAHQPHTPTLIFYLSGAGNQKDADAIRTSVQKLKSATTLDVNTNRSYTRVRFDSHVVSYHQVAQAIVDAGKTLGENYNPCLIFSVSEYAQSNNAAKVDAIFAGKRLNTRVTVKPLDKNKGEFSVHFLPLKVDPNETTPQGFNGGHLHHPISDPPPRGLGLTSSYASDDDPSMSAEPKVIEPKL
jgi:copper chaperone CopZ